MAKYTPKYMKKRRFGNRLTRKLLLILMLTMVLFSATVWGASARYVYHSERVGTVKAKEFYFTSDYLVPGGKEYVINPGNTAVAVQLRNYDGLKVSELAVNYSLKVNGSERQTGTLPANAKTEETINLTGLAPGSYTVTATGSNGYTRDISATFVVKGSTKGVYKHTEIHSDYVILTVWTQGVGTTATVNIPAGLIPDRTDPALQGKSGSFTVSLNEDESKSFRFFTTADYGGGAVGVTAGGSTVDETGLS